MSAERDELFRLAPEAAADAAEVLRLAAQAVRDLSDEVVALELLGRRTLRRHPEKLNDGSPLTAVGLVAAALRRADLQLKAVPVVEADTSNPQSLRAARDAELADLSAVTTLLSRMSDDIIKALGRLAVQSVDNDNVSIAARKSAREQIASIVRVELTRARQAGNNPQPG